MPTGGRGFTGFHRRAGLMIRMVKPFDDVARIRLTAIELVSLRVSLGPESRIQELVSVGVLACFRVWPITLFLKVIL